MAQRLRLQDPNVGGDGSIPDWGIRSHKPCNMAKKENNNRIKQQSLTSEVPQKSPNSMLLRPLVYAIGI